MVPHTDMQFTLNAEELELFCGLYALVKAAAHEWQQAAQFEASASKTSAKAHAIKAKGLEASIAASLESAPENVKAALKCLRDRLTVKKQS
jgi:hypothetical protein